WEASRRWTPGGAVILLRQAPKAQPNAVAALSFCLCRSTGGRRVSYIFSEPRFAECRLRPSISSPDKVGSGLAGGRNEIQRAECRPDLRPSALLHELRAQDEALDAFVAAVDFLRVSGQADRLDERAALEGLARTLDDEVLDERDLVAV